MALDCEIVRDTSVHDLNKPANKGKVSVLDGDINISMIFEKPDANLAEARV